MHGPGGGRDRSVTVTTGIGLPLNGRYIPSMRSAAPALLPIFRSQTQAEILALLMLHPDQEFSLTDLSRRIKAPLTSIHREVERLVEAALIAERPVGRNRMVHANLDHPASEPLIRLLELSFGPRHVVADEFAAIPGARQVMIYGSWAARHAGETGAAPHDVDVLVVGEGVARGDVYDAADRAQARLGLPVNPTIRTTAQWVYPGDTLSSQIRSSPTLTIVGEENADGTLTAG
jgi:DNA-binding transcriptional ArsR family regulator